MRPNESTINAHREELKRLQDQILAHGNNAGQCFETALSLNQCVLPALLSEAEFSQEDITGMVTTLSLSSLFLKMGHTFHMLEKADKNTGHE